MTRRVVEPATNKFPEVGNELAVSEPDTRGVLERIRHQSSSLSEALSKVADEVLDDPIRAARATIMDLAERSGTSPGTITRFCRHLGYDGYAALRVALATESGRAAATQSESNWEVNIGREISHDDSLSEVLKQIIAVDVAMLRNTAQTLDLTEVQRVAEAVIAANRVDVYGIGNSSFVARELHTGFYRTGVTTWLWTEVHDALASAALLGRQDVAIAVSHSGAVSETIEMLTEADSRGALTVAITSYSNSPITEVANVVLTSATRGTGFRADLLSARHAQLLVADLVYIAVAQRRFPQSVEAFESRARAVVGHRPQPRTHDEI